jgi:drug/metabolite transporter (DMT)-like permease
MTARRGSSWAASSCCAGTTSASATATAITAPADAAAEDGRRARLVGWACALGLLAVWTSFHLMSRLTARQGLTPWDVAALRFAGAFLTVLPILAWRRRLPRIAPRRVPAVLVFAGFGFPLAAYAGYQFAPAAHGATVMAAGLPVAALALGAALGMARLTARALVSLGAVVAGSLLLVASGGGAAAGPGAWRGDLLFLAAVGSWAVYTVLVQRWRLPALDATLLIGLCAAPLYLPVWALLLPSAIGAASPAVLVTQMLFHGTGAVVVAGLLFTRSVTALGPGPTTLIGALVPGFAALIAWPLLGETLSAWGMAAVALVMAGMAVGVAGRRG